MQNIRAYKSISEWRENLRAEGYFVPPELCDCISQIMESRSMSFAEAYELLAENGAIILAGLSKQSLDLLLHPMETKSKREKINDALGKLEDAKGKIFGRKVGMHIKDDIHLFFSAMDYFYKTFPYGKDADIEFEEEMNRFDVFVTYTRKLRERIEQYERNNKPNKIIVHKYKFPELEEVDGRI